MHDLHKLDAGAQAVIIVASAMRRAVHPVYWIGLVALFAVQIPLLPQVSEANVPRVNQWLATLGEQTGFVYEPEPTVEF